MPKADQAYWEDKYRIEYREARKALRSVGGRGSIWDNGNDYEDQTQSYEKMFPEYWEKLDEDQKLVEFQKN